jgi:hypothetical protein
MSERVLFFSPHAGVWGHAFPEALVADSVRRAGGDVIYVTCGGALSSGCATMAAYGVRGDSSEAAKAKVCRRCKLNKRLIRRDFGFDGYDFDSVLTDADEQHIQTLLREARPDDVDAFVVDGTRVGSATLYEYLIQQKRFHRVFDATEWAAFLPRLANTLRSFFAARRIIEQERPTRIVAYNTLYSVNAVWRAVAAARGIPVFVLHAGPNLHRRLQTLMIGRDSTTLAMYRLIREWPAHAHVPANHDELACVTDHFCEVLRGSSVFSYSTPKVGNVDWRSRFGIRTDQQLLVATLSSYDEYTAARAIGEQPDESGLMFPTQIDWIRALVAWIRDRPDRFLLVRVHPREFPNKREGAKSQHATMLERELANLPANVRVNWPTDNLSMHDIAEHADVVLNAWSSAGKELALLGIPVVVYCPSLLMYPPEINYVGDTEVAYYAAIETALHDGWSLEHARKAFRWCAIEYQRAIADLGDGFDYVEALPTTFLEKVRSVIMTTPGVRPAYDLWRRPLELVEGERLAKVIIDAKTSLFDVPMPRAVATELEETAALRHELGRLAAALYGNDTATPEPGSLRAHLTHAVRSSTR